MLDDRTGSTRQVPASIGTLLWNAAQRLIEAGVPTELVVMPGAFHGFDVLGAGTQLGKSFNATKLDALRRVLA